MIYMLNEYIKTFEKSSIVSSILMILVAILLILFPKTMINIAVVLFAAALLVDGIIHMGYFFMMEPEVRVYSNDLFWGIIMIVLGLLVFMNKTLVTATIPYLLGTWMILKGFMNLQLSLQMIRIVEFNRFWIFIGGVIEVIAGLLVVFHPFGFLDLLVVISGIFLLITEVIDLSDSIYVLRQMNSYRKFR